MESGATWVIPCGIRITQLQGLLRVLESEQVTYRLVAPERLAEALVDHGQPALAVIRALAPGIEVFEALRRLTDQGTPTMAIVDVLNEEQEVVMLDTGALEVVGLPTSSRLLRARLLRIHDHVMNRSGTRPEEPYAAENVTLTPTLHEVRVDHQVVALTKTEYRLLAALIREPHRVLTRDELARSANDRGDLAPHTLESHLSRLRGKLQAAGGPRLIEPVRGVGYRLRR
jgi:DNA-binding response OmpR family regulator